MNDKIILFSKIFYSNKAIIEARKLNFFFVLIIILVSVILSSVPLYMGRVSMNTDEIKANLPGIDEAFSELYNLEPNIKISESGELIVGDNFSITNVGNYKIKFENNIEEKDNAIIFLSQGMIIQYYLSEDNKFSIAGSYNFLKGFDFSKVKTEKHEDISYDLYYNNITNNIVHSVHYADTAIDFIQTTIYQFIQISFYSLVIAVLFLFSNKTSGRKFLTYPESIKMIILASLGPAFLVAILSFVNNQLAAFSFSIIFTIRLVFIYMRLMRTSIKIVNEEEGKI